MKGLSPLIASVLLIGFTVAVAGVLGAWLTSFARTSTGTVEEESTEQLTCIYGGISLSNLCWYTGNYLSGRITNTGRVTLGNITLEVIYGGSVISVDLCRSGNTIYNCTGKVGSKLSLSVREVASFNLSNITTGYTAIYVRTNCSSVYDTADSGDVSTSC